MNSVSGVAPATNQLAAGVGYAVACYSLWGLVPLYFAWVGFARPEEILAHRVLWSVLILLGLIALRRGWSVLASFTGPQYAWLALSGVLLAINWSVFVWAVLQERVIETSLGYYINPLISVILGVLLLGERLRLRQWVAVILASVGVIYQAFSLGEMPWLGLVLAFSFGLYSLVRKRVAIDPVVGLGVETVLLLPLALAYLVWLGVYAQQPSATASLQGWELVKLALGGPATILPLLLFGSALNRLPLTVMSFIQYLAPTLSLLVAVWVLGEAWRPGHFVTFGFIWFAVLLFSADAVIHQRKLMRMNQL